MLEVPSENLPQKARGRQVLHSVLHTLAYADVFDYPLSAGEVFRYITSMRASREEIQAALENEDSCARMGDYFTLHGREDIIEIRKRRAKIAERLWTKAVWYGSLIAVLPFVRMVAVTGSLAMNNTDEGRDIDFMIATAPGHLWTCRALSLLIARVAKLEGVSLCPNYLVTTEALELSDRSLYVAHELAQMIPLSGMEVYAELRRQNTWTDEYLPNALGSPELPPHVKPVQNRSQIQNVFEFVFHFPFAGWLEKWEMDRKIARLTREQSSSLESCFTADICKGHIDRHGENVARVLAARFQKPTEPTKTI